MPRQTDQRPPLDRALEVVDGLKAGSWESVETLALLAVEARHTGRGVELREAARTAAAGLKAGSWESARALVLLARADRELG